MSGAKTILIAHRQPSIRDRFAAALADARHGYVMAETDTAALAAIAADPTPVSLVLADLGLASDGVGFVKALKRQPAPVVVFAGTIGTARDVRALVDLGVAGYVNEHAATAQILPSLAPYLFPDSFDRRASARVALGVAVSYRAGPTIARALMLNIGKGGIAVRTMTPLAMDTPVQIRFKLPGRGADQESCEIDATGRVVWSDRHVGMGIRFDRMDAAAQNAIDRFVDHR